MALERTCRWTPSVWATWRFWQTKRQRCTTWQGQAHGCTIRTPHLFEVDPGYLTFYTYRASLCWKRCVCLGRSPWNLVPMDVLDRQRSNVCPSHSFPHIYYVRRRWSLPELLSLLQVGVLVLSNIWDSWMPPIPILSQHRAFSFFCWQRTSSLGLYRSFRDSLPRNSHSPTYPHSHRQATRRWSVPLGQPHGIVGKWHRWIGGFRL